MDSKEELYKVLYERAFEIVSLSFGKASLIPLQEFAHDITVDFLYFSKSYTRTFDAAKGELIKFFASYVRKKALGITIRTAKKNRKVLQISGDPGYRDAFEVKMECRDRIVVLSQALRGKYFLYGRRFHPKKLSLERLFFENILSFLDNGKVHKRQLAERLNLSTCLLREALVVMQETLKREIRDGRA